MKNDNSVEVWVRMPSISPYIWRTGDAVLKNIYKGSEAVVFDRVCHGVGVEDSKAPDFAN